MLITDQVATAPCTAPIQVAIPIFEAKPLYGTITIAPLLLLRDLLAFLAIVLVPATLRGSPSFTGCGCFGVFSISTCRSAINIGRINRRTEWSVSHRPVSPSGVRRAKRTHHRTSTAHLGGALSEPDTVEAWRDVAFNGSCL